MRVMLMVRLTAPTRWSEIVAHRIKRLIEAAEATVRIGLLAESPLASEASRFFETQLPQARPVSLTAQEDALEDTEAVLIVDDHTLVTSEWLRAAVGTLEMHPAADVIVGRTAMFFTSMPPIEVIWAFPELEDGFVFGSQRTQVEAVGESCPFLLTNVALRRNALATTIAVTPSAHPWTIGYCSGQLLWAPRLVVHRWSPAEETSRTALASYLRALGAAASLENSVAGVRRSTPRWMWRRFGETALGVAANRLRTPRRPPRLIQSGRVRRSRPSGQHFGMLWWRELHFLYGFVRPRRAGLMTQLSTRASSQCSAPARQV
jgi:hypothetical protein